MSRIWSAESPAFLGALGVIVVLGLLSGEWFISTFVVMGIYILWLYRRLGRLEKWVRRGTKVSQVFDDGGFIGTIVRHLYQQKKLHNLRKRRTKAILGQLNRNISALPDATVLLNSDHEIVWCNEPASYLLNIRSPQDIGHRVDNLIRYPVFIDYLSNIQAQSAIEIDSPTDAQITVQLKLIEIGGNQILLIARNVSDQKQLQESLKNFVANASHELKTPLTVISGHLEMLEAESGLTEPGKASLKTARRQTERMQDLIRNLLLLSQVESYQLRPDEGDKIAVSEIMANTMSAMEKFDDRDRVEYDFPDDAQLLGVKAELEGICINLVENALKYSTPETPISATWDRNVLGELEFTVIDQGPGIDPSDMPHITNRYYRAAQSASDIAGSGLGLSIVQQAANKHGAILQITGGSGEPTRFTVAFPSYRCVREEVKTARLYHLSDY